jgi:hypothetical protein
MDGKACRSGMGNGNCCDSTRFAPGLNGDFRNEFDVLVLSIDPNFSVEGFDAAMNGG